MNGIYTTVRNIQKNSKRFYAGTTYIKVFPGISMTNNQGSLSWCHHIIVAVTKYAIDHKEPETIMYFANKDWSLHFKIYGEHDDYERSEVPGSRLVGVMDVKKCIDKYRNPGDKIRYRSVDPNLFIKKRNDIVEKYSEFKVELTEDCETINKKLEL